MVGGILSPDTVSCKRKTKGNLGKVNTAVNRKRICLDNDERSMNLCLILNNSALRSSSLQILKCTSKSFRYNNMSG